MVVTAANFTLQKTIEPSFTSDAFTILQAGRQAFENRLLILAFKDTLHSPEYVATENIFAAGDAAGMIAAIKELSDHKEYARLLSLQEDYAGSETAGHFKEVLLKATNKSNVRMRQN